MLVAMLLPKGTRVGVAIEGSQQANNRLLVTTSAIRVEPLWWPVLGRELHPGFCAFELGLHISLLSVRLLNIVAWITANAIAGTRCLASGR